MLDDEVNGVGFQVRVVYMCVPCVHVHGDALTQVKWMVFLV